MRVGLLTGGGDCPGLNAVIRAVVQRVVNGGGSCVGILEGWRGLVRGMSRELDIAETDEIIAKGGTILGSSRTNPFKNPATDIPALQANFEALGLDALVAIGGDDTLGVAHRLHKDFHMPMVGIPKTIDNDLMVTDFTFGFDTAINIVTEAVDRLRTTTESHRRIMVVETMGRHAGWIACFAGIAVAADYILVPEVPIDIAHLVDVLKRRRAAGKNYGIVIVSEGARIPRQGARQPRGRARRLRPRPARRGRQRGRARSSRTRPASRPAASSWATSSAAAPRAPTTASWPPGSASPPATRPPETLRDHGRPLRDQDHRNHPRRRRGRQQDPRPDLLQRGRRVLPVSMSIDGSWPTRSRADPDIPRQIEKI